MKLRALVKKTSNGLISVEVDDAVGRMLQSLFNVLIIRGDDRITLPKYHEETQHRFEVLEEAGFDISSPKVRDVYINELKD